MSAQQDELKKLSAKAALDCIKKKSLPKNTIIGVGTGSTTNFFIDQLATIKHEIGGTVASSIATEKRLKFHNIPVFDLTTINEISVYVDGADEINDDLQLIKGGGGALTREKIIAAAAKEFICIADQSKKVNVLGQFPLPIEIIPMARTYVSQKLTELGGIAEYRENFTTDNGNIILDIKELKITKARELEKIINNIVGVVTNGLFANRTADVVYLAAEKGIVTLHKNKENL